MQPVLFTIPGLDWAVQSYGFCIGLALLLGWFIALRLARSLELDAARLGTVYVIGAGLAFGAARWAWVLQHPDAWAGPASLFMLTAGELAPFAGAFVGLLVCGGLAARARVPVWSWYDALAPAIAVGIVLERAGALLAGTGFGRITDEAWYSVRFGAESPAFAEHRRALSNLMSVTATESLPVHATQLYGAGLGLVGVGVCYWLWTRRAFRGQVFIGFAIYHLAARSFVEEWVRADASAPVFWTLNAGQMFAAVMIVSLLVVARVFSRRQTSRNARAAGKGKGRPPGRGRGKKKGRR